MNDTETETYPEWVDAEAYEAVCNLFKVLPPADSEYKDSTPVTVTLTRGAALNLLGALRASAQGPLGNVRMSQMLGLTPADADADETNETLRLIVEAETAVTAAVGAFETHPDVVLNEDGFAVERETEAVPF